MFSERIRELRERENLTQQEMADILDVSKSTYVKYERGEREPRYGVLVALSQYFDVTIDYILGKSDQENPYIELIGELKDVVQSEQFISIYGNNVRNVQKIIADFTQIVLISEYDHVNLDSLYVLTQIEKKMLTLRAVGTHLFCYHKWAADDLEYKELVPEPTPDDMEEFLRTISVLREILDDYIKIISSPEYHLNRDLHYEKEISEYATINKSDLMEKFRNDPRYKMKL